MSAALIRTASPADAGDLAILRFQWERPGATPHSRELADFAVILAAWMESHRDSSIGKIAIADGAPVGMAWLAIVDRVPNPSDHHRRSGDVQSVFVLPEWRKRGVGRGLVDAICETAAELGVSRLSLHSSAAAIPFYEGVGFTSSDHLLQRNSDS